MGVPGLFLFIFVFSNNLRNKTVDFNSGQSYKYFTLVNYDSRVANTSKLLILTTLES